jgi:hypothetical protein
LKLISSGIYAGGFLNNSKKILTADVLLENQELHHQKKALKRVK